MKQIEVDLSVVKSLSDKIFSNGYLENEKNSILAYRSGRKSTTIDIGIARGFYEDNMLCFIECNILHDIELKALLSEEYHKRGLYIDFSFVGDNTMYGKVYSF